MVKAIDESYAQSKKIPPIVKELDKRKEDLDKEYERKEKEAYKEIRKSLLNYSREHVIDWGTMVTDEFVMYRNKTAWELYCEMIDLMLQLQALGTEFSHSISDKHNTKSFEMKLNTGGPCSRGEYGSVEIKLVRVSPEYINGNLELLIDGKLCASCDSPYFLVLQYNMMNYIQKARELKPALFAQNGKEALKYIHVGNTVVNLFYD